uniref:Uncharacterized protein n=1 Tax=Ananas comosus var. bracteatus TaxID=296719 RepID=A0A6V7Q9E6_ANACO|nr:unnamed protein product [Ananas comosus var. bracteatus]
MLTPWHPSPPVVAINVAITGGNNGGIVVRGNGGGEEEAWKFPNMGFEHVLQSPLPLLRMNNFIHKKLGTSYHNGTGAVAVASRPLRCLLMSSTRTTLMLSPSPAAPL